uniref:Adenine DNA glycosylase n=1 Tax=Candidatus Kentrum sp. MB TaxID=2138164 RepID=A0A450Y122_9GAMM|nr:MAG: A/G-specific DNA-adenine glycosylase [Candidatus Kentron sp. MB]VFK77171.1 MAG: A/G-specific DNA-adenine glycosylase [Candidatus Kentron sp. MB]
MLFSDLVIAWYEEKGRRELPWQRETTGYRVWISEIMLQQTRVTTVREYFERFMAHFPTVRELALAESNQLLHLWSGLGYYARARNLHQAARIIHEQYGDVFPTEFETVRALPGIGRSTAGAILALAFGQRHPILDGNVKRVLTRYHGITGWPSDTVVAKKLWALAERYTPHHRVAKYTQAMMDLGAIVCTRTRPSCPQCPLRDACHAHATGKQQAFPTKRPKKALPVRTTRFILVMRGENSGNGSPDHPQACSVLLKRRPATGIWGGLWSFPECDPATDLDFWCVEQLGAPPMEKEPLPSFRHTFTHFHLDIHPILLRYQAVTNRILRKGTAPYAMETCENDYDREDNPTIWYPLDQSSTDSPPALGLAAPVTRLLEICRDAMRQRGPIQFENPYSYDESARNE